MNLLALETTERCGSVAAMSHGKLLLELNLDPETRSAQSLAPAVKRAMEETRWAPTDVDLVAVPVGPGSFTGLRVGVTTAKILAYCMKAEVLGVDTLQTIAAKIPDEVQTVALGVDAQRGQVVAALFRRDPTGRLSPEAPSRLVDLKPWLSELPAQTAVSGPFLRKWQSHVPAHVTLLDAEFWTPSARGVAQVALERHAAGQRHELFGLAPRYSRRSAAEEQWEHRH